MHYGASCLLLLTVPSSPENVTLVTLTTSSSRLRVTWTIDPPDGLVSNYTIYVTRLERGSTVVIYTSTNTQLLQFDIPNLDPYELVEVSVSASNSAGEGPRSPGVRGRTREERKLRMILCTDNQLETIYRPVGRGFTRTLAPFDFQNIHRLTVHFKCPTV